MNPRGNGSLAFYEIARYALTSRKSPLLPTLWALTYDVIAVPPPDHASGETDVKAVITHVIVSIAGNFPVMAQNALRSKYLLQYDGKDLAASKDYYSEDSLRRIESFMKFCHRSDHLSYTQAEFDRIKRECDLVFWGY
jgi:hypothetical protein